MTRHLFGIASLVLSTWNCAGASQAAAPLPSGGHHVLFIGNSLTYTNDLPATVSAIAALAGDTIRYATEAGPNLALIDHITGSTNALARIAQGGWEYVILQQGPTPAGICRDSLVLWTKMFDARIKAVGAKSAVFMAWPYQGPLTWFDEIRVSFEQAASGVNGVFLPAGEAWRSALTADGSLSLYSSDGFHPTPTGTFLAALEVYERITGRDVRTLPPKAFSGGVPLSMPEATVRKLQEAAHDANTRYPAKVAPSPAVANSAASKASC
jgi:hypothetical protein